MFDASVLCVAAAAAAAARRASFVGVFLGRVATRFLLSSRPESMYLSVGHVGWTTSYLAVLPSGTADGVASLHRLLSLGNSCNSRFATPNLGSIPYSYFHGAISVSCLAVAGFLLDFSRRVFLDLLFLLERRFAARLAEASLPSAPCRVSEDPLAELFCAVMDVLDGTGGTCVYFVYDLFVRCVRVRVVPFGACVLCIVCYVCVVCVFLLLCIV